MQLTVENLVVCRGERPIIDGLSFSLKASEALILLGPNGSGKTTLIRALAGFLRPRSGTISLEGSDIDPEQPLAEQCHYVGHANGIKSNLTVIENLEFWFRYLGGNSNATAHASCDMALRQFDLLDLADIPAGYLSAGQKRRLGIARLLVAHRPIWLLDEPTVSLDAHSVTLLSDAVKTHTGSHGLVIAATHIPLGLEDAHELHLTRGQVPA